MVTASFVAEPELTEIALDETFVKPAAAKLSVREPAVPEIDRLLNVATPPASVDTLVVPPSVPPPVRMLTVTATPDWLTALPPASRS